MNEIDKSVDIGFLRILDVIKKVTTPKGGIEILRTLIDFTPKIENALNLATKSHEKANKERELELSTYLEELICDYKNLLDMEIVFSAELGSTQIP
ncbi:hypothetical protein Q6A68_08245, partial [Helicobacter pylori]|nr:hypothetical protein [Helicobacter pylori]